MEFYRIVLNDGKYEMEDDEEQENGVELTQEQLGILMDKLGSMYNRGNNILRMRKYCLMYYENAVKEYINLAAIPSMLIHEKRLENKFEKKILADAFSITLLEGEEENRISVSCDGTIENRGFSIMQVIEMMDEMVSALNESKTEEKEWCNFDFPLERLPELLKNSHAYFLNVADDYSEDALDFNQTEVDFYKMIDKKGNVAYLNFDALPQEWAKIEINLLHQKGHYVVRIEQNGKIVILQRHYSWEKVNELPSGVKKYVKEVVKSA